MLLTSLRDVFNEDAYFLFLDVYGRYPEAWDVSVLTDFTMMFDTFKFLNYGEPAPNSAFHIGLWDTSSVTQMTLLFKDSTINVYIGQWNVTSLQNAHGMFKNCQTFDQPIDEWDLVSLKDAKHMFDNCNPEFAQAYVAHVGKYI